MIESTQLDDLIEKLEEMVRIAARPIIGDTSKLDKTLTKLYGQKQTEIIFRIANSLERRSYV